MPGVLVGAHHTMSHLEGLEEVAVLRHEPVESLEVFRAHAPGRNDSPRAGLQVLEYFRFLEWKFDFIRIQRLENNHLMPMKPQLLESQRHLIRRLQQVREKQNDAPAM